MNVYALRNGVRGRAIMENLKVVKIWSYPGLGLMLDLAIVPAESPPPAPEETSGGTKSRLTLTGATVLAESAALAQDRRSRCCCIW